MSDTKNTNAFGWAPVGARLLREYSQTTPPLETPPTVRYAKTWSEIKALPIMQQLLTLAVQQMVMLHAVDTLPRGGMCQGDALKESIRRYEKLWLPLIAQQQQQHAAAAAAGSGGQQQQGYSALVPPLDIALLWHLHRLQPEAYAADCKELRTQSGAHSAVLHVLPQQAFAFSDGSDAAGAATAALWRKAHPAEPFWPPAAPGSQTAGFRSRLSADLAAVAVRVPVFTHQLLRAAYVSRPFLSRAVDRYAKFLLLRKHHLELQHPIPPLDIALMWASHMSTSGMYAADCQQLLQRMFLDLPGASASLWLERDATGPWRFHWTDTQRAWLDEFDEPFVVPASGYVPLSSPHPAELLFSPTLLAAFETSSSSPKQTPWRAGAHALYLSWLRNPNLQLQQQYQEQQAVYLQQKAQHDAHEAAHPQPALLQQQQQQLPSQQQQQQQRKKKGGGLFACFGCGGGGVGDEEEEDAAQQQQQQYQQQQQLQLQEQERRAASPVAPHPPSHVAMLNEQGLMKLLEGFSSYKNLPCSSSHPYWTELLPRGPDAAAEVPTEEGAEVEVYTTTSAGAAAGGYMNGSSGRQADVRAGADQGAAGYYTEGDYEVTAAGGQPLMW